MKVRVDRCWGGGSKHYFRLTFPCGGREIVLGEDWTRKVAGQALDTAEHCYGAVRRSVRFHHAN